MQKVAVVRDLVRSGTIYLIALVVPHCPSPAAARRRPPLAVAYYSSHKAGNILVKRSRRRGIRSAAEKIDATYLTAFSVPPSPPARGRDVLWMLPVPRHAFCVLVLGVTLADFKVKVLLKISVNGRFIPR